ncbi:extensin-like domain-containing protein [Rhodoplanes sp. Z2-YC6860]|uniref:extensin-like domain-containing protein n=1 Tax=Rhodoplanes sp. Z2-YC6860 TaxID=674703 RepID=UPI00078E85ED|nr:extensin family protein [Rhodoplanes sp. Z2-YC6860]AMN40856.1 extensin [Rhodoplanes sp. Z2-YC6860]
MSRGVSWILAGSIILVALAGCGRSFFSYEQRAPWRKEAELACLNSGTVREGPGVVRISPIDGPGMCGADFPLKISALGESSAMGYLDEAVRPPGAIPGAPQAAQPRWPISRQSYDAQPSPPGAPMSIEAPGSAQQGGYQQLGAPPSNLRAPSDWQRVQPGYQQQPSYNPPPQQTYSQPQYRQAPPPPPEAEEELPDYAQPGAPPTVRSQPSRPLPPLGPPRPQQVAASQPVEVKPAATLACPIVSALDHWIANSVQPAANKWFRQPVAEIKQISAYSCRGMNGQPGAKISEHAFGNALDVAAFVLADGRRITVKDGWKGSPEEQGFLRDVQGAACDQFTTVLAPGSNAFHYDHIHVDLMRRASGRRICQPGAVDGDVVAARARQNPVYASRRVYEAPPTRRYDPPTDQASDPFAWRGDRRDPGVTGSVARHPAPNNPAADDNDWVEEPGPRPAIDWTAKRHQVN